jgi:3-methyl-2-oxobutanoate hydroxymethyltransferase
MYNFERFAKKNAASKKITMVTCYDTWSAKIIDNTNVDSVLVGDSLAMVMHGFPNTLHATVTMMAMHTAAVARGITKKVIVADMPFMSTRGSLDQAVAAAQALMTAGAHAIKIEGADGHEKLIEHLVNSGIPVMGHLGLTPQSVFTLGGFKVQGRTDKQVEALMKDAKTLENSGCFSLVLECVPNTVGREVTNSLSISTIGIGAGPDTSGQVLVLQDLLGLNGEFKPKFLRKFAPGESIINEAINNFCSQVNDRQFPNALESYE